MRGVVGTARGRSIPAFGIASKMTIRRKLTAAVVAAMIVVVAVFLGPKLLFAWGVSHSLAEQGVRVRAAKPLFDAVVTSKLKIGDSLAHATEVLTYAGMTCDPSREKPPRELQSVYRVGDGAGFFVKLELSPEGRVTKIGIQEFYTGP